MCPMSYTNPPQHLKQLVLLDTRVLAWQTFQTNRTCTVMNISTYYANWGMEFEMKILSLLQFLWAWHSLTFSEFAGKIEALG